MPFVTQEVGGGVSSRADYPAQDAVNVTPSDSVDIYFRALYIGGAGNVQVTTMGGTTVLFSGCPAGLVLPISGSRVWSTNTNATLIVALV